MARREELDLGARDGRDQLGDTSGVVAGPLGSRTTSDFGLRQLDRRKHRAQCCVLSGQAVVGRHDAMKRPQRVRRQHHVGLGERRGTNQLGSSVGRAAIGIDHDRAQARKITREAHVHGANDVHDRRGIVQRRQADEDVHLPDGHQLPE